MKLRDKIRESLAQRVDNPELITDQMIDDLLEVVAQHLDGIQVKLWDDDGQK